jgi:hypothetical protein
MTALINAIKQNTLFQQVQSENKAVQFQDLGIEKLGFLMETLNLPMTLKAVRAAFAMTVVLVKYQVDAKETGVK